MLIEVGGEQNMSVSLVEVKCNRVKVELTVELSRSMLETEEVIQVALNEAGTRLGKLVA